MPKVQNVINLLRSGRLQREYVDKQLIDMKEHDGFVLLDYSRDCQYESAWDEVTTACRGLIIDSRDWSVAARPFMKFFNLGEGGGVQPKDLPREPFRVFEKLDGSMGTLYRKRDGKLAITTRGSFDSEQGAKGTEMLHKLKNLDSIDDNLTLIFEIIYTDPRSPHLVKYAGEGLVLLAAFNRHTGEEMDWWTLTNVARRLGVAMPRTYEFKSIEEIQEKTKVLPHDFEGYVVRFQNGLRVKMKGRAYLRVMKLMSHLTPRAVLEHLQAGTYFSTLKMLPEELRPDVESLAGPMIKSAGELEAECHKHLANAPTGDQKEFALWVKEKFQNPIAGALFKLKKGQQPDWYEIANQKEK